MQTKEDPAAMNEMTLSNGTPKYRIGTVSRLTGLSADVVRVWERRYQAIQPHRTEGGSRLYSDNDIERLRRLRQAVELGYAIGQVARTPDAELDQFTRPARTVMPLPESQDPHQRVRENFLTAIARLDVVTADFEINRAATLFPPRVLVQHLVSPLLTEIGERWAHQEFGIAQEHVATNLIRNLLSSLIRLYPPATNAESIVMATPPGERHEFGLLQAALYAAMRGWRVIYLGLDLPIAEMLQAVKLAKARVLALSLVNPNLPDLDEAVHQLAQQVPLTTRVWLGGPEAERRHTLIEQYHWTLLRDFADLDNRLRM
jgi:DNA-binding transcriptional MerR regulator